jgi:hypothetical protein
MHFVYEPEEEEQLFVAGAYHIACLREHENKTRKFVQVATYSACRTNKQILTRSFTLSL